MIVGRRGVGIRGIMQQYRVDIKMPRDGDDKVIVSRLFDFEILSVIQTQMMYRICYY